MKQLTRAATAIAVVLACSAGRAEAWFGNGAFGYCGGCGYYGYGGYSYGGGYGYGGYGYGYGLYPAPNAYYPAAYSPYVYYQPPAYPYVAAPAYPVATAGYTVAYVPGVPGSSAANYYSLYPPAGYYPYATVGYYGYLPAYYQPYPPVYYYTSANLAVVPTYPAVVVEQVVVPKKMQTAPVNPPPK